LPEGNLEFLGRVDQQVKVRGFRIELGEIESVLLGQAGVREAVVVVREEAGDKRLVGYVVCEAGAEAVSVVSGLRSRLQEQLPGYMVPSQLMVLESLPLTGNGKVDRQGLPVPQESGQGQYTAPEGLTEQLLAELWSGLLKRERVGRQDNFFDLGGHSLLAMQLVSRIREAFSTELAVREVFENATLSSQARAVERARGAGALIELPLEPVSRDQPLALSHAQQRLWFLHQYMGPNAVYNMPLALRLRGEVDEAALVRTLEELHRRHESLRTHFESRDRSAVQVIDPPGLGLKVEVVSEADLAAIVNAEHRYCFDLSNEPLCRIRLLREIGSGSADYVLLVTMHHSVSDGWSLGIFFREFVSLYRAYSKGENSPLAPLPIQYADYAQWQRRWLQGAVLEEQLSYWREQLKDLPPLLTLPTDRPRPSEQSFRGRREPFALPLALTERLQALSREQGVTLFMTLLSGWAVLLSRYSGQRDIAVGTPVANRTRRETEGLIGFFLNMLVLRTDLRGNPRFVDLLKQTRQVALQAYAHQDVPFEQLVEELNPERSVGHSPLFQVAFGLVNTPSGTEELPDLAVLPLRGEAGEDQEGTARFDITLNMQESTLGLVGGLEYSSDLFDRETIRHLLDHYARLLESIAASPQSRLSRLEMLSDAERRQQLIEGNAMVRTYSDDRCIHELFEEQARRCPQAIAIVDADREFTYRELNERANQFAHRLIKRGVGPGVPVAICVEHGMKRAVGVLGILKAGGAYVPLDSERVERLDYLLEDSDAAVIITQSWVRDEALQGYPNANPEVAVSAAALGCVRYEADASGEPVGRMISHTGLVEKSLSGSQESSAGWLESLLSWPMDWPAAVARQAEAHDVPRYILDRDGELLPAGAVGELYVGGEAAGWGYLHRSGLTAERFVPNAFSAVPGERLYRTGERARWTVEGMLELVDQKQAPSPSPEAEQHEIERALLSHEGVREAVVQALEVVPGELRLVAYVVERAPGSMAAEGFIAQLQAHLRAQRTFGRLPHEWMVLECLPRTAEGAVDLSGLPQPRGLQEGLAYVAPRTALERTLAEVWQEQLGIERVGVEDNYFVLGGDSIRSIALVAQARERGVNVSIKDLFTCPTISSLASALERGEIGDHLEVDQEIEPFALLTQAEREQLGQRHDTAAVEDAYPLSMMQQGMVVEALRHADLKVYQNFQIYELKDEWDAQLFDQALRHLMNRHPMLRAVHDFSGERPLQLVLKEKTPELQVLDVRHLDKAGIQRAIGEWAQSELSIGLDTTVTLWRAAVHVMPSEQFLFGMYLHHALWDGWSLESFATELYSTYGSLKRGDCITQRPRLPSYNRFIALEQSAMSSEAHREYWMRKLQDATAPWWTGREKSATAYLQCEVPPETSHRLSELARSLGVQDKSIWCSVYLALLSLLSGTDEGVGMVITQGRPEVPGGEKIIGVFLNALPTRVKVSGRRWAELITETDRELREQHTFRHYPLAEIQRLTGLDFSATMFN
jgi:non-ribosomal peptide synthetase component F/aryl carrier-like protein